MMTNKMIVLITTHSLCWIGILDHLFWLTILAIPAFITMVFLVLIEASTTGENRQ